MAGLNEEEHRAVREFGKIAKQNGYCGTVCFAIGAIAFDKNNGSNEINTLNEIIELAKQYPNEDDFMEKVEEKYFPPV